METALFDFVKGGAKIAKILMLILESPQISSQGIYLFFMIFGAHSWGGGAFKKLTVKAPILRNITRTV